ncbi:MAG: hypothetical protein AAGK78_05875, partial [Planctomycetota bacterium]
ALALTGWLALSFDWAGVRSAWLVAAGVGLFAIIVTLPLLMAVAGRVASADADGLMRLAAVVLAAGMIRVVVVAVGIVIPVKMYGSSTWPTFGFVAAHYFLLTAAEVGVLGRLFWRKDADAPATGKADVTASPASPAGDTGRPAGEADSGAA